MRRLGKFEIDYEHHDFDVIWFVIEQPPDWPNTIHFSLGSDVRGLMLPKYPQQIQAGLLLPTGAWRDWREAGVAAVAERVRGLDPVFADFVITCTTFGHFSHSQDKLPWSKIGRALGWCSSAMLPTP